MKRVLLVQPSVQPPGGSNGVAAWVLQARALDLSFGPYAFEASQLQFVNPALS